MAIKASTIKSFYKLCKDNNYKISLPYIGEVYIGMLTRDIMNLLLTCQRGVSFTRNPDTSVCQVADENGVYLIYKHYGDNLVEITYPDLLDLVPDEIKYVSDNKTYISNNSIDGCMMLFTSNDTVAIKTVKNVKSHIVSYTKEEIKPAYNLRDYARAEADEFMHLYNRKTTSNRVLPVLDGSEDIGQSAGEIARLNKEIADINKKLEDHKFRNGYLRYADESLRDIKEKLKKVEEELADRIEQYKASCDYYRVEMYVAKGKILRKPDGFYVMVPNSKKPEVKYVPEYETFTLPKYANMDYDNKAHAVGMKAVDHNGHFEDEIVYQTDKVINLREEVYADKDWDEANKIIYELKKIEFNYNEDIRKRDYYKKKLQEAEGDIERHTEANKERQEMLDKRKALEAQLQEARDNLDTRRDNFNK